MEYPYMEKYDDTWNTMEANFSVSHFFLSISEILSFSQTRKNRFSNYNQSHMLHVWNIYPCLSHLGKCWRIYHTCGMLGMGHIWRNHPEIVGFFSDDYI